MVLGRPVKYSLKSGNVEVALVEDKVSVVREGSRINQVILEPNQWVKISNENTSMVVNEGLGKRLLWKESILEFEEKKLIEVADMLESWYGVDVDVQSSKDSECKMVGTFQIESLENVLKGLQFVIGIDYKLNEDSVILSGGGCL